MLVQANDVLLDTAGFKDYRKKLREWADVVVGMSLQGSYGVQARRLGKAGMGIYLCRQDND